MTLAGFPRRPAYKVYRLLWAGLDWLYPPLCGGCKKTGARWCEECRSKVEVVGESVCTICGEFCTDGEICRDCKANPPACNSIRSWAFFSGPLREAIHRLKYSNDIGLGDALAEPMIGLFHNLGWQVDLVTPVPLSRSRFLDRGYNQSSFLARPLALAEGIPYRPGAVQRIRHTASQVDLSAQERLANVKGAFLANPGLVNGKVVLVIDDVITTGSTIDACAQSILQAGSKGVYGLSLARPHFSSERRPSTHSNV